VIEPNGQVVGHFSENIIFLLGLNIEVGTEIILSPTTVEHINRKHPEITGNLYEKAAEILLNPEYVGYSPRKNTIDFIVSENERLRVPVRPASDGIYYARSIFKLHKRDFERLKRSGSIFPVDKTKKS